MDLNKPAHSADRSRRETLSALGSALRIAADTLWAHKLRSFLTVLGIVIGIAAVVLVGAAVETLREYAIATTAQAFGSNTFLISQVASAGTLSRKELADKLRRNSEIYRREAEALGRLVSGVARTAATLQAVADVKSGNRTFLAASVTGTTAGLEAIKNIRLSEGRFFTDEENRRARRVAVTGQDIVGELFPSLDPLGKEVRIEGQPFEIIGVQEKEGSSFGSSQDRYVWIPLQTFEKIWGSRRSVVIFAQPRNATEYDLSREETRAAFRKLRGLRPGKTDDFDILTPDAGRSFLGRLTGMIAAIIVPISSVAVFVAGIVVMNMMLVSVTERTREIGIRKSLGARKSDILSQILFESTLLTMAGGGFGVTLSYSGTIGLSRAFGTAVGMPLAYVLLAVCLAAAVGLAAGLYPAYLASRMQPVEALRAET
jgi:putative ABC transport system permease protein